MAKPFRIQIKKLKELQGMMKRAETAIEPEQVKPILAEGLLLIRDEAHRLLKSQTKRRENLPPGWEHIEEALEVKEGKSARIASAFLKVFRRKAPQAIWIEFGHRIVGHRPNRTFTGKMVPARPFFRPAVVAMRAAARRVIVKGLKRLLKDASGDPRINPNDTRAA